MKYLVVLLLLWPSLAAAQSTSPPVSPPGDGTAKADDKCIFTAMGYGAFPMEPDDGGHMAIRVPIGDKQRLMIVDTGGAFSMVSSAVARDLDLTPVASDQARQIDVQGHITSSFVTVPTITMGRARFRNARFVIAPDDDPLVLRGKADGLLGPDVLGNFDVDLDFQHSEVHLFDQNHCPGKIPYWAPMYASTPFVLDDNGHILVDMTLDGKPVTVGVDTGAPTSVMSLPAAQRLFGLGPESPGVEPAGSVGDSNDPSQKVYRHRFVSLVVGGLEVKNPMIALMPDNFMDVSHGRVHLPDVILGLKQIASLHLYIAYKEKALYFTAVGAEYPGAEEAREELQQAIAKSRATGKPVTLDSGLAVEAPKP
jgi:predicted aspartyl protease